MDKILNLFLYISKVNENNFQHLKKHFTFSAKTTFRYCVYLMPDSAL
jgi:hypothetical protein